MVNAQDGKQARFNAILPSGPRMVYPARHKTKGGNIMDMGNSLGRLVLRLTVGGLLLMHGVHKLLGGIGPIEHMIAAHGLPAALAYGVYIGEVVAPLLVIAGLFARVGGLLIALNMVVAVLLAGMDRLFAVNAVGGYALELEAFYLFGGIAIMLLGAGSLSLGGANGRWN